MRLVFLVVLIAIPALAQKPADCWLQRKHGKEQEARQCFLALTRMQDPFARGEGFWGLKDYDTANGEFKKAAAKNNKDADVKVRWGKLLLERFNPKDAADLFQEALELKEDYPPALIALAGLASERFESKAVELAAKAIEKDPKLYEAQELLAWLALEDNDEEKAIKEADKAIKISGDALDAMAIRATIEMLHDKPGKEWLDRIFAVNPNYGEAYSQAAHFFVINRRYEEGIVLYEKALALDPALLSAKSELGVTYMRLGREPQARKLLEECYAQNYRNAATANTLTLMDSYKNFKTFESNNTIVRLHKKESDLLKLYIEPELKRAIATFEVKYKTKLKGPVQLEVYPDHEDFAVRTMGMPGLGALGVTFGNVVAMDSPSGRTPGAFHWASTLWHELSHVFVLSATEHRVPRWFTEGLAVHEETAAAPDWGDRLDPQAIAAVKGKKLLPIATLDRGFVRPSYPQQVIVSYFQAGKICDYINEKWGYSTLLDMMHGFAAKKTTVEVVEEYLKMKPEEFDKEFLAWLDKRVGKTVNGFEDWRKKLRAVAEAAKAKKWDDVLKEGVSARDLYPDYVEFGSVYEFLADAYKEKGDKLAAMRELQAYSKVGGRNPGVLKELSKMEAEAGLKKEAAATLERLNFIYPVQDEDMHRRLGGLYADLGNQELAVREYRAVVASKPVDVAGAYFNLASALKSQNKIEEAKDNLIQALEAAPSYRPAQKLLLELSK